ncbi:MAG: hypothetical protein WCT25_03715 [Candidatus Paceibacterota bacterium]|jgi:hypothetical protein
MRDLSTRDYRFGFIEPIGGVLGEIPFILVHRSEEMPPIDKVFVLYVNCYSRHSLVQSDLVLVWLMEETGIVIKSYCRADDPRLRAQYKNCSEFAEKVMAMLLLSEERGRPSEIYRRTEIGAKLKKDELPGYLRPIIVRVEGWKVFFGRPEVRQIRGGYYARISEDGYYVAPIGRAWLRLGERVLKDGLPFDEEYTILDDELGFHFDPNDQSPIVVSDAIYWQLEGSRVLVVLPHASANEKVATYYGYLKQFNEFNAAVNEARERIKVAAKANAAREEEVINARALDLRKALLE